MKNLLFTLLFLIGCRNEIAPTVRIEPEKPSPLTKNVDFPVQTDHLCSWQVKFSPNGGAEQQVVDAINSSEKSIYMLSYSFTSEKIAEALANKSKTQFVGVILDPSNLHGKGSKLNLLLKSKAEVYIDKKHAIAHNKTVVIDERKLLTGSFNFTAAAEHNNAENSLLLVCPHLAKEYLENWDLHKQHSEKLN